MDQCEPKVFTFYIKERLISNAFVSDNRLFAISFETGECIVSLHNMFKPIEKSIIGCPPNYSVKIDWFLKSFMKGSFTLILMTFSP